MEFLNFIFTLKKDSIGLTWKRKEVWLETEKRNFFHQDSAPVHKGALALGKTGYGTRFAQSSPLSSILGTLRLPSVSKLEDIVLELRITFDEKSLEGRRWIFSQLSRLLLPRLILKKH
ncbi:hypothetical protein TNCV_3735021 [Trichonephila clavipes]|nr:hypothetical protein TNCV_3735021 [Trichonephila clavipes]